MLPLIVGGRKIVKDGVTENGIPNAYTFITSRSTPEEQLLAKWTRYPEAFIEEALGFNASNGMRLGRQQRRLFSQIGDLAWAKKLMWDNKDHIERIPRAIREVGRKTGVSVRAGKGITKTASEALLILWFLFTHKNAKIPILGPTEDHIKRVLLSEIHKWLGYRNKEGKNIVCDLVRGCIHADTEKIYFKDKDVEEASWGKNWFAFLKVASKNTDKNVTRQLLSGLHEENMMIVFDEASGIAQDEVFEPLENTLTGRCNFCLMTFNPSRNTGYAHDSHQHHTISKQWLQLHWNAEDTEEFIISREHIKRMEERYGSRDSNHYRVNVLGEFPTADDGSLIPYLWVRRAIDATMGIQGTDIPVVMGVDVARDGSDSTVCCVRHGPLVKCFHSISAIDSDDVALDALKFARKHDVEVIYVDAIGVGAGVYDRLKHYYKRTHPVKVSEQAKRPEKFMRLRDELWWKARERFESGFISIPDIQDLVEQLSSVSYTDQSVAGKIKVEGKDSMKKRLGGSPDYADALNLTFMCDDNIFRPVKKKDAWRSAIEEREQDAGTEATWLSV